MMTGPKDNVKVGDQQREDEYFRPWICNFFERGGSPMSPPLVGSDDELGEKLVRQRVKILTVELAITPRT